MKRSLAITLALIPLSIAAAPATRPLLPQPPAVPLARPAVVDVRQPAFIPKFAKPDPLPAGHFAERDYAYRYTWPGGIYYGYGYYVGGSYGYGPGTWGGTQIPFR